ncbi:uncharacterized protein MONBRDRAFT_24350 [Monosiga brevicollis MX1]|uniref:UspA domain-containing protein n=1 Tax=Monosiga brevicollis TaxID=81824 RepID=A9UW55_MONBE|nr:uncharacterized protein MONBRDRAFT_24350 [Monosiga brevicollis MX1]EDQ90503.1 predicted protein [Monosiga brevicollis MX1]|eukprot:XP_001744554.1 hypothetical protein [Monosiga brevicollis MX1]
MASRTVLVGVDASETSANAFNFASKQCRPGDVMHVCYAYAPLMDFVGPEFSKAPTEAQHQAWREQEEQRFQKFMESLPKPDGVKVESHIMAGDARQVLTDMASTKSADQVVVGTHGRGFLGRAIMGSVSSYLTHHSPVPVTVVPKDQK